MDETCDTEQTDIRDIKTVIKCFMPWCKSLKHRY